MTVVMYKNCSTLIHSYCIYNFFSISVILSSPQLYVHDISQLLEQVTVTCRVFPQGLLNKGPRDSLCGVKGSLIVIQGFVVLKRIKLLQKY